MKYENLEIGGSEVLYVLEGKWRDEWWSFKYEAKVTLNEANMLMAKYKLDDNEPYSTYRIIKVTTTRELVELT